MVTVTCPDASSVFVLAALLAAEVIPAVEVVLTGVLGILVAGAVLLTAVGSSAFTSLALTQPARVPAASSTAETSPVALTMIFLSLIVLRLSGFIPGKNPEGWNDVFPLIFRWVSCEPAGEVRQRFTTSTRAASVRP